MLNELIHRARRRLILNEALNESALALAVALGGFVLILLAGTRFLEWWTLTVFAAAGIVWGLARARRRMPDSYTTAVKLDQNAGLPDTISTAWYFGEHKAQASGFADKQRWQAEEALRTLDLKIAAPVVLPRMIFAAGLVGAAALALMLLRLSMGHGLDLQAPITEVLFEDRAVTAAKKGGAYDADRRRSIEAAESLLSKMGVPVNPNEAQSEEALDQAIDQALQGEAQPPAGGSKAGQDQGQEGSGNNLNQKPDGDPMGGQQDSKNEGSEGGQEQQGDQQGNNGKAGDNQSSSLLSKMKDAISNLLSNSSQQKSGQTPPQNGRGQQANSEKAAQEKGEKGQGKQGGEQQASDSNTPGQDTLSAQSEQPPSQNSSAAGSGAGSQDGGKDTRLAAQMQAMGKISEIIGKRSQTVSGETMVEVEAGGQKLRTAYSKQSASHGEADSDVTRDEIPVSMQAYVQQYFQQVHKPAAKGKSDQQAEPAAK
jgi:hypothetical protein